MSNEFAADCGKLPNRVTVDVLGRVIRLRRRSTGSTSWFGRHEHDDARVLLYVSLEGWCCNPKARDVDPVAMISSATLASVAELIIAGYQSSDLAKVIREDRAVRGLRS